MDAPSVRRIDGVANRQIERVNKTDGHGRTVDRDRGRKRRWPEEFRKKPVAWRGDLHSSTRTGPTGEGGVAGGRWGRLPGKNGLQYLGGHRP